MRRIRAISSSDILPHLIVVRCQRSTESDGLSVEITFFARILLKRGVWCCSVSDSDLSISDKDRI